MLLMLFMFCFFVGFAAMFYYLLRRLDSQCQLLSDEHAQLRVLLRALESRLDKMDSQDAAEPGAIKQPRAADAADKAGRDPLLHLSFEDPASMDKAAGYGLDIDLDAGMPGRN